jgi:hypothetical protein
LGRRSPSSVAKRDFGYVVGIHTGFEASGVVRAFI